MATLSQATSATRGLLKWAAIAFAVFLVIRLILFPLGKSLFLTFFPPKPPPPTTAFGKLPKIPFPEKQALANLTYTIQTTTGFLPPTCPVNLCAENTNPTQPVAIPDQFSVFAVIPKQAVFSSYDVIKQKVGAIGFLGEGTQLSPTSYVWKHPKNEEKQITFDTTTQSFTLTSNLASATTGNQPPPGSEATTIAKTFLGAMALLPNDLDDDKTAVTFLKLKNGQLTEATSLSEATFVQVDFYRNLLSRTPIVYPNPQQSLLSFLIQTDPDKKGIVAQAHYSYKLTDENNPSTYPIKTAREAFEELQQGKAYIPASIVGGKQTIAIQRVYLGYYEGSDKLPYFLPVFVFEGDGGFLALVEAVRDGWLE